MRHLSKITDGAHRVSWEEVRCLAVEFGKMSIEKFIKAFILSQYHNKVMKRDLLHKNSAALLMFSVLSFSAVAQEAHENTTHELSSAVRQEERQQVSSTPTTLEKTNALSQTAKTSSDSSATNDSSSNSEVDSAGVVPIDPSMAVPETTSNNNSTTTPLPTDPNAESVTEIPGDEKSTVNDTESIEKKKHEIRVRYNQVRIQVEKEEAIIALHQAADKAATMEGKRQTLKAYYELLFHRMKQIDASLTERCDVMQGAYLRHLEQGNIEPTIPLHLSSGESEETTDHHEKIPSTKKEKSHQKSSSPTLLPK
jgi:hypothetical protein